jgi:hypothetical protein
MSRWFDSHSDFCLSGLRIFAVANGDRPTLVTLLGTLDVKAVLLGTFASLLPTA